MNDICNNCGHEKRFHHDGKGIWAKGCNQPLAMEVGCPCRTSFTARPDECEHDKGKMIAFDEDNFIGTWECKLCGEPFSQKAGIVCGEDEKMNPFQDINDAMMSELLGDSTTARPDDEKGLTVKQRLQKQVRELERQLAAERDLRDRLAEIKRLITRLAPPDSTRVSDASARIHDICDECLGDVARKIEASETEEI